MRDGIGLAAEYIFSDAMRDPEQRPPDGVGPDLQHLGKRGTSLDHARSADAAQAAREFSATAQLLKPFQDQFAVHRMQLVRERHLQSSARRCALYCFLQILQQSEAVLSRQQGCLETTVRLGKDKG
jgi:hypothetical protein